MDDKYNVLLSMSFSDLCTYPSGRFRTNMYICLDNEYNVLLSMPFSDLCTYPSGHFRTNMNI